jgi:hypothetical protein
MNGDSPFPGSDVFFNVSLKNVRRGGGITERASERQSLRDMRARTHTRAAKVAVVGRHVALAGAYQGGKLEMYSLIVVSSGKTLDCAPQIQLALCADGIADAKSSTALAKSSVTTWNLALQ